MSKRFTTYAATAVVTATVLISAPSASAAGHTPKPVVTQVKTVAEFDFATGDAPENITVNPDNSVTLSMLGAVAEKAPKLVKVTPSGHRTTLATGHEGDQITGNTRGSDGTVYYNVWSENASRSGVWKLPVGGSAQRLAALPTDGLPNGLALDSAGRTLYVADSLKSTIWAVPASGGRANAWLTDPALAPTPDASLNLGVNGLRIHNGAIWVTNFNKATLSKIPVTADGTPGRINTVTNKLTSVDDFTFLSEHSDVVFAARHEPTAQITVVYPDGATKAALTAKDGLASPTSAAVKGNRLYITNAGLNAPHDSHLQRGTVNPSQLLTHSGPQHR
ncbi:SMP-30/gluconolactonase/LRE family protein [Streptomyces tibetensis]|uniref:SMP-30/gluconolactonase/LRE family protein n=1 Tax=Streptomyces tibetensis TaxID=2382123 RepID=UPI00340819BC